MKLDDYCCLGRTVPEQSKKYGRKVCTAGYSAELRQFMRVYPCPVESPMQQRHVCHLQLERNSQDSRIESWQLARERTDDGILAVHEARPSNQVIAYLDQHKAPSIAYLNERRLSLGIIKPVGLRGYFRDAQTDKDIDPDQRGLFDDLDFTFGMGQITRAPYLRFSDEAGAHDLQLREWGCYEWLRRQPDSASQLWDNLRLRQQERDFYLLVGNMAHHRNVWLVIALYSQASAGPLFAQEV